MVNVHPQPAESAPPPRFNVLLTDDRPHRAEEHWSVQLPRLLRPQGVASYLVHTGREAVDLAGRMEFHAVVVDVATPVDAHRSGATLSGTRGGGGGLWLLELFQRMPQRPPVVVLNSPAFSQRDVQRFLHESLRLGAFSVLNKPIELEQLLSVFRKLLDRQYRGAWPGGA